MRSNPHSSPEGDGARKSEVSPEVEASHEIKALPANKAYSPGSKTSLNSAIARMRRAAYHTIAEFYLLYGEYYLPVSSIICSYISHVKPSCKKPQVNLRLHLTILTRAANPFMINKKIIFIFPDHIQTSFKLNIAYEQASLQIIFPQT